MFITGVKKREDIRALLNSAENGNHYDFTLITFEIGVFEIHKKYLRSCLHKASKRSDTDGKFIVDYISQIHKNK